MSDSNGFKVNTVKNAGEPTTVVFSGSMDELSDFSSVDLNGEKAVIFDFDQVFWVNSIGLRHWVLFVKTIPNSTIIHFHNLRPMIIHQLNILAGFLPPGALVQSFYVPYACETCDYSEDRLYHRGDQYQTATSESKSVLNIESIDCPNGHGPLEIDAIEAKYFNFLYR